MRNLKVSITIHIKRYRAVIALMILGLCAWIIYYHSYYRDLEPFALNPDILRYAEAAKQMVSNQGLATNILTSVYRLNLSGGIVPVVFPFLDFPPLHPIVIAAFMWTFGASNKVISLSSGLSFLLTIPLIYMLGKSIFSRGTGLLAAFMFAINPFTLQISVHGMSEPLYTFLLVLFIFLVNQYHSIASLLLAAFIYGLSWLTRLTGLLYFAPSVIYVFFVKKERRLLYSILFAVVVYLTVLPYQQWQAKVQEDLPSLGILHGTSRGTGIYEEWNPNRSLRGLPDQKDGLDFIISFPFVFAQKMMSNITNYVKRSIFLAANPLIMLFFVLGIFRQDRTHRCYQQQVKLKFLILVYLLATVVFASIKIGVVIRYLYPLLPFIFIFAADYLIFLCDKTASFLKWSKKSVLSSVVAVTTIPFTIFGLTWFSPKYGDQPLYTGFTQFIQQHITSDEIILTNVPWTTGYYGNRTSVWMPNSLEDLVEIEEINPSLAILLVDGDSFGNGPQLNTFDLGEKDNQIGFYNNVWEQIFVSKTIPNTGFYRVWEFNNGRMQAVLFKSRLMSSKSGQVAMTQYVPPASMLYFDRVLDPTRSKKVQGELLFEIFANNGEVEQQVFSKRLDKNKMQYREYLSEIVDLGQFAGEEIIFSFVASSSNVQNNRVDWSYFGQPVIASRSIALQSVLSRAFEHSLSVGELTILINDIEQFTNTYPDEAWPFIYLAKAYIAQAKTSEEQEAVEAYSRAVNIYQKAWPLTTNNLEAQNNLINDLLTVDKQYINQDLLADIIGSYEKRIHDDPTDKQAYNSLNRMFWASGEFEQAVEFYNTITDRWPENADAHFYLGRIYEFQSKETDAIHQYEKVMVLDPAYYPVYTRLAAIYSDQNNVQETAGLYQLASDNNPTAAWPHLELGQLYLEQAMSNAPN